MLELGLLAFVLSLGFYLGRKESGWFRDLILDIGTRYGSPNSKKIIKRKEKKSLEVARDYVDKSNNYITINVTNAEDAETIMENVKFK